MYLEYSWHAVSFEIQNRSRGCTVDNSVADIIFAERSKALTMENHICLSSSRRPEVA